MINILFEVAAIDPLSGATVTLRMSTVKAGADGVLLNGFEWKPILIGGPIFSFDRWGENGPQPLETSYGEIAFLLSSDINNYDWTKYSFDGALATVWIGNVGDAWASYRQLWQGSCGALIRDSDKAAHVALLGPEAALAKPLMTSTYAGTGGAEGPSALTGSIKPISFGECTNVEPVLVDTTYWIYQVNAYTPTAINAVYSNALTLGPPVTTVSSFAALAALALAPGEWAAAPAVGMFRLGADPTGGKITADIGTAATAGAIISSLLLSAGLLSTKIDTASMAAANRSDCLYSYADRTILDSIRSLASDSGKYLVADSAGKFFLADHVSSKTAQPLTDDGSTKVRPNTIKQNVEPAPVWRVKVGHTKVWAVHSPDEISPAIAEIGADIAALDQAAQDAQDAADAAQADADFAKARLASIANDSILDRTEKLDLIQKWTAIAAEQAGLLSTASGLSVSSAALTTTYNALAAYLTSLSPAWYDTTQDTAITRSNFDAAWTNYYDARQTLENAIANAAALRANWPNITGSGKPADGATRNVITFGSSAPSSPVNGDIWVDNGHNPPLQYSLWGGVWTVSANTITDTSQVTDGAGLGTKADWINVTGSGKPQDNADVTALSQHSLTIVSPFSISANYDGTINSGQLPAVRTPRRYVGTTDVSSSANWSISTTGGLTGTLNNSSGDDERGTVTLTAMSAASGTIRVASSYNSITLYEDIDVVRVDAAPPSTGGGGGGGAPGSPASMSSFTPPLTNTSHQVMSSTLAVVVGGSGQVNLTAPLSFDCSSQGNIDPTSVDITETFLAGKWQYSSTGSGSWTDVGSETVASSGAYRFNQIIVPKGIRAGPGYCYVGASATGLTSGSTAYFRLVGRMDSGTSVTSVTGTATATPV